MWGMVGLVLAVKYINMLDPGHWNIKGILKNAKKAGQSPLGNTFKKYKEHKPAGKALALANKLKKQK
jgi:hypothetical protein